MNPTTDKDALERKRKELQAEFDKAQRMARQWEQRSSDVGFDLIDVESQIDKLEQAGKEGGKA